MLSITKSEERRASVVGYLHGFVNRSYILALMRPHDLTYKMDPVTCGMLVITNRLRHPSIRLTDLEIYSTFRMFTEIVRVRKLSDENLRAD